MVRGDPTGVSDTDILDARAVQKPARGLGAAESRGHGDARVLLVVRLGPLRLRLHWRDRNYTDADDDLPRQNCDVLSGSNRCDRSLAPKRTFFVPKWTASRSVLEVRGYTLALLSVVAGEKRNGAELVGNEDQAGTRSTWGQGRMDISRWSHYATSTSYLQCATRTSPTLVPSNM